MKIERTTILAVLAMIAVLAGTVQANQGTIPKWSQRPQDGVGGNKESSMDWRVLAGSDGTIPGWVQADDFRSDGRPILAVRWWGSYFDPVDEPTLDLDSNQYKTTVEDGFVLSFFSDIPADQNPAGFSLPGQLLGAYIAPDSAVRIKPTAFVGWDQHPVWEYEVHLQDTRLDHAVTPPATADEFLEQAGTIYWLSIAAQTGHALSELADGTWVSTDSGKPERQDHFWGWHTSPDAFNDLATMGDLFMPEPDSWQYDNWLPMEPLHDTGDQAFELLTVPEPATLGLLVIGGLALIRRKRVG